jgi:hypothetical protein
MPRSRGCDSGGNETGRHETRVGEGLRWVLLNARIFDSRGALLDDGRFDDWLSLFTTDAW